MVIESQPTINFVVSQNESTDFIVISGGNQEIAVDYVHDLFYDYGL